MANRKIPLTPAESRALKARLGKDYDVTVAKEFNVSRQYVAGQRKDKDIAAYNPKPRSKHTTVISAAVSKADVTETKKAMIKSGVKHRSTYVRDAVRARNKAVLDE